MAAVSHNHANYQVCLDYIQQLLIVHLGLGSKDIQQTRITPIQYEPDSPFKYNNFVYHLSLPTDASGGLADTDGGHKLQLGCIHIPAGTRELILRLSNPDAEGMHQETRVQNEVGILTLASDALRHVKPPVFPRVIGWGGASREHGGWILQEFMLGIPVAEAFSEIMSLDQKKGILGQMAELLKALQDYQLPRSIHGWGGVTFDDSGAIVSAPMTSVGAGPWSSHEDSFRGRLKVALTKADMNPHIQAWHVNGVRGRVDAFIEHGLPAQFSHLTTKQDKAIIHADFSRITALLDYDFASILHSAYEFFRSFSSNGGQFPGWSGDTTSQKLEAEALRKAKLSGQFPSPLPAPGASDNGPGIDWELAQAWEEKLQKRDVKRPSTIQGIDKVADVDQLLRSLLPWRFTNEDF